MRSYAVKLTLQGQSIVLGIEVREGDYVETKTIKAHRRRKLNLKVQSIAFSVSPEEITAIVLGKGETSEHDFLVTPKPDYRGKQKRLFQVFRQDVYLMTLNADITIKLDPEPGLSRLSTSITCIDGSSNQVPVYQSLAYVFLARQGTLSASE